MPTDREAENEIEAALVRLVRRTTDPRGNQRLNRRAGVDLDRSAWTAVLRIAEHEPIRLSELADIIGVDTSTASRQVAPLVAGGLVQRRRDPQDSRALLHELTPDGREVLEKMRLARREWIDQILTPFDRAERRRLARMLTKLIESMDENDPRR